MRTRIAAVPSRFGPTLPIALATAALFVLSPVVQSGTLSSSALATMLPFAAILAIAAIGQTLVIQQGGLDFSIAGTISLASVILCKHADGQGDRLVSSIVLVLGIAAAIGLVNGLVVTRLRITPLVATLGVNALLLGGVQQVSNGVQVPSSPDALSSWALGRTLGIFNPVLLAAVVLLGAWIVMKRSVAGRRFEAVGANAAAATVAGLRPHRHRIAAYVLASLSYAVAGILLAGYLRAPNLQVGDSYLLATIAAVVIGGTALTGGAGSVIGSALGALFLTQLAALLAAVGAQTSVNYLVQGAAIAASMASHTVVRVHRGRRRRAAALSLASGSTVKEAIL